MSADDRPRTRNSVIFSLKLTGAILAGALLLTLARQQGWLDTDQVARGFNIVLGVAFAIYGNAIPKMMEATPPTTLREATVAQSIARVAGWSMTVAFVIWTALWVFAPMAVARIGSIVAVVASVVIMMGYSLWKLAATRPSRST